MFTVPATNYKGTPKKGLAPFTTIAKTAAAPSLAPGWDFTRSSQREIESIVLKDYVDRIEDDISYIVLPNDVELITKIEGIQGKYRPNLDDEIGIGEYEYDYPTRTLKVNLQENESLELLYASAPKTTTFPVPSNNCIPNQHKYLSELAIFNKYDFEVNFTIKKEFNNLPDVSSVTLLIPKAGWQEYLPQIEVDFKQGRKLQLFGLGLISDGWVEDWGDGARQEVKVTVNFTSEWADYNNPSRNILDLPVRQINFGSSLALISLQTMAQYLGIIYEGVDIRWFQPRNLDNTIFTNFRDEFSSRLSGYGAYADYEKPGCVRSRLWSDYQTHVLLDWEIGTRSQHHEGGGTKVNGVCLTREYRNAVVTVASQESPTTEDGNQINTLTTFENASNQFEVTTPGIDFGGYLYNRSEILKSVNANFDTGGMTKSYRSRNLVNGSVTSERFAKWGLAYTSEDTNDVDLTESGAGYTIKFNGASPNSFWQEVERESTVYRYDAQGYLTSKSMTGRRLHRVKQESTDFEVANLKGELLQEDDPEAREKIEAQIEQFKFNRTTTITGDTRVQLRSLLVFPDSNQLDTSAPNYIEPKYAARTVTSKQSFTTNPDAASTDEVGLPDLISGKWSVDEVQQIVTDYNPPRHIWQQTTKSQEGLYGFAAARQTNVTEVSGKPSIHTRLNSNFNGGSVSAAGGIKELTKTPAIKARINSLDSRDVLIDSAKVEEENIQFKGIYNLDCAIAAAKTKLNMINTFNAAPLTIKLNSWRWSDFRMGDRICYLGKLYRIKSLSYTVNFDGKDLTFSNGNLVLGQEVEIPTQQEKIFSYVN